MSCATRKSIRLLRPSLTRPPVGRVQSSCEGVFLFLLMKSRITVVEISGYLGDRKDVEWVFERYPVRCLGSQGDKENRKASRNQGGSREVASVEVQ